MGDGGVVACAPSRSLIAALASKPFKMRRAEDDGKDSPNGDDRRVEIEDGELIPDRSPQRGDFAPGKRRKGADSERYDVSRSREGTGMERRRKGSRERARSPDDIYRRRDRDRDSWRGDDRDWGWRERTPEDSHRRTWGWQKDGPERDRSPGLDLNRTPEDTHQRKEWGWRKDAVVDDRRRDGDWPKDGLERDHTPDDRWRKDGLERDRTPDDRRRDSDWRKDGLERDRTPDDRRRDGDWRKDGLERDRTPDDRRRDGDWRKDGLERGRTPENTQGRKDWDESASEYRKRLPSKLERFEGGSYEQDPKKYPEELRQKKYELSNGKGREKGYDADNRQKRHCPEFDSSSRKYNAEHADRPGSRSWKDGEDWKPQANRDRSYQDASSISSRGSSVGKYSTSRRHIESSLPSRGGHERHNESSLPSRGGHDRHGRSPERARHHDPQDRSPSYLERPQRDSARQYDHRNHTPGSTDRPHHERSRHQDYRDISPSRSNRSPRERGRYLDYRDRTPSHYDRSPYERVRSRDHRDHTPNNSDRSSQERVRYHDQQAQSPSHSNRSPVVYRERDRTPGRSENSSHDRGRNSDPWDQYKKVGSSERQQSSRLEERPARESSGKDAPKNSSSWQSNSSSSNCHDIDVGDDSKKKNGSESSNKEPIEPSLPSPPPPPPPPFLPPPPLPPHPEANGILEELPSMEEDMDICDTPPHDTITTDMGKWSYIDQLGIQRGPSKLADLQRLVEEGFLQSDHLVTHSDTHMWVTVENAASPMLPTDLPSTVSDVVTQMVISRESPGNVLDDSGHHIPEMFDSKLLQESQLEDGRIAPESVEDLCIDERVEALLNGQMIMDGNERQNLGEALGVNFEHVEWEKWGQSEGFTGLHVRNDASFEGPIVEGAGRTIDDLAGEATEIRPSAPYETEYAIGNHVFSDCFAGRWSCKGGDWKRNDENYKRKTVLNEGYPLCQMEKFLLEDPRLYRKDDLYYASRLRKLDLVPWSFSSSEDMYENDVNKNMSAVRTGQIKLPVTRGVKGTMLPVVRINACVVKEHVSNEPRMKVKGKERHTPRSSRAHSSLNDINSVSEGSYHSKKLHKRDLQSLHECRTALNMPKDHVCTVDELSLHLGGWYYLDGAGHEHGPSSYSELQELVTKGTIPEYSSVFRKIDNTWLPIATSAVASKAVHTQDVVPAANISTATLATQSLINHAGANNVSGSFHSVYPQFVGYMRGKLHELVMKSYKNREFAAAINEVLDPWLSSSQPKKDVDKHFACNSSFTKSSATLAHVSSGDKFWKSDASMPGIFEDSAVKRVRLLVDGSGESEAEERLLAGLKNDRSFEELCGEASFVEDVGTSSQAETECWGSLDGHILARIFHFLRTDLKSLCSSANTCKRWNMAVKFYNSLCKHVEFSAAGLNCTDSMFQSIMHAYEKKNITSIGLAGCSNVSARMLEEVLPLLPCLSIIDIRGCSQFKDLEYKYQGIMWIKISPGTRIPEETYSNVRSLKQITEESFSGLDSYLNDVGEAGYAGSREVNMVDRKDPSHTSRQGFYKRRKLLDSKNSSTIPSRDAQMRHWLYRKSKNGYRKMEEFIALSLKDIMKGNRFEFFIPKVAKIEGKMKSGYYIRNGLGSVKDDISRMCRDALKAKTRDNVGDLQQVILSFIKLAQSLKEKPKLSREREEMLKKLKDGSDTGFFSLTTKYSKKQNKVTSEKKGINRSQNTYANGGTDHESYVFDREIKRSLFKLKKIRGSESEPSDDNDDDLSDDVRGGTESTDSDTESDLDLHLGGGRVDRKYKKYSMPDDVVDSMEDDREWGARMTKASLVPPVTRTYELINEYLIIADEEEVRRKMSVCLPDDFAEKLLAQDTGMEETDMELPKVKEYKPRKIVGVEVLEQEVYGIDPYTHNLLLDSMPDEPDWPLAEKHKFVEEVLPCILNKQVRHFTGVGNTPMVYPLRLVVEEIQKKAEKDGDGHIIRMCQTILKAMQARPDDNYVAYRKGLGVVCNKEEGFDEDDFVVEFLGEVYPIWKWFEKQDGIKSLQKNSEEQVPEFYNIYLERPKGDRDGYDLVIVDAMHKANFASRICHSCKPNCEAKVIAVNGQYQIGIYTVRPISYGEEITFDYNCVTDSMKEYEDSVCLCGSQVCRGSYLNLTGEDAFQKVLDDCHGILDRHKFMLEACESNSVSQEDYIDLGRAGLGACLLAGLPDWLVAYSAHLVRFINFERTRLPDEILKHNLEEKRKIFSDISLEVEKNEAEVQAEGVYNSRLQSMAITLDKVRYVMRCVFGDAKTSPPPLQKLSPEALVSVIWEGEGSLVEELLQSMAPHVEEDILDSLKSNIDARNPSRSGDLRRELRKSLLWLRDELRNFPCSSKCRNDAAADLIHMYAYTKCFFKVREYKTIKSPPVYISPLDLGPKYADKMGSGLQEYRKTYDEKYCLSQLIYWHSTQPKIDPVCSLAEARKGCLSLPDVSSFYAKSNKPSGQHVYGSRTLRFMMSRMERQPQTPWPEDRIWSFKSRPRFFGSPMLDAVLNSGPLDKEMMHWLKTRPVVFHGAWDG